ncbi:MAG: polyprenyl synthetase family protein [Pseudomonadota bacterium]
MATAARIEQAIEAALATHLAEDCPPRLAAAVRYAVLPGGARLRPRLCCSVAAACAADNARIVDAAAVSIELLHCASLVHDDLPCFDNADLRRGKPTVHVAFDERLALLCGDELIVMAFEVLAAGAVARPERLQSLMRVIGRSVGAPNGIIAGQAYECEPGVDLRAYQQAKTGALFAASTEAGAAAAGVEAAPWRALGGRLGEAYQVADDLLDACGNVADMGKPTGQDHKHGRPSAIQALGFDGALARLNGLVADAIASIPDCVGREPLARLIGAEAEQLASRLRRLRAAA